MKRSITAVIAVAVMCVALFAMPRNTRSKLVRPSSSKVVENTSAIVITADTLTDTRDIDSCLMITDYQKTLRSRVESLMITNRTVADTIRHLVIDIDYHDTSGTQLNRREVSIDVTVPPGETRHVSFQAWDRQQLFYYHLTPPVRPTDRTRPFTVTITPLSLVLTH